MTRKTARPDFGKGSAASQHGGGDMWVNPESFAALTRRVAELESQVAMAHAALVEVERFMRDPVRWRGHYARPLRASLRQAAIMTEPLEPLPVLGDKRRDNSNT